MFYILPLLHILIHLQLSIVSRYVLIDQQTTSNNGLPGTKEFDMSALIGSTEKGRFREGTSGLPAPITLPPPLAEQINKTYFSLSSHLQQQSIQEIMEIVHRIVRDVMEKWKLGALCSFQDMQITLEEIHSRIISELQSSPINSSPFVRFLFPSEQQTDTIIEAFSPQIDPQLLLLSRQRLQEMIAETRTVMSTQNFQSVVHTTISSGFALLSPALQQAFEKPTTSNTNVISAENKEGEHEVTQQMIPFANVS